MKMENEEPKRNGKSGLAGFLEMLNEELEGVKVEKALDILLVIKNSTNTTPDD